MLGDLYTEISYHLYLTDFTHVNVIPSTGDPRIGRWMTPFKTQDKSLAYDLRSDSMIRNDGERLGIPIS